MPVRNKIKTTVNLEELSLQELDDLERAICEERRRKQTKEMGELKEKLFKVLREIWDAGYGLQYDYYINPDNPDSLNIVMRDED